MDTPTSDSMYLHVIFAVYFEFPPDFLVCLSFYLSLFSYKASILRFKNQLVTQVKEDKMSRYSFTTKHFYPYVLLCLSLLMPGNLSPIVFGTSYHMSPLGTKIKADVLYLMMVLVFDWPLVLYSTADLSHVRYWFQLPCRVVISY